MNLRRPRGGPNPDPPPSNPPRIEPPPRERGLAATESVFLSLVADNALHALAAGRVPVGIAALPGALPPVFVAQRALRHLAAGKPARWCATYFIHDSAGTVVGGCGFKDAPLAGEVEIGYAVAPRWRGRGAATAAVRQLLAIAARDGDVRTVIASVNPQNTASIRVVEKARFVAEERFIDSDGEELVRWCHRLSRATPAAA